MTARALINRELRRVPLHWVHPRDARGEWIPLANRRSLTDEVVAELMAEGAAGTREEIERDYMPEFSDVPAAKTGIQAYETTTEGTPISPVFPDTPDGRFALVRYCADHETVFGPHPATMEEWVRILCGNDRAAVDLDTDTSMVPSEPGISN
jgi:hypothetical protein